jgi:elongation factor 1-alpha
MHVRFVLGGGTGLKTFSCANGIESHVFVLQVKAGYSPIGFVRCGRSACRIKAINWKVGKETGGKKLEGPHAIKANEMAEIVFEPVQPLVVDTFKNCEGLSRIAFLDGNTAVMLGKVVKTEAK